MYCPYCGYKMQEDFVYCPQCGKIIDKNNSSIEIDNFNNSVNRSDERSFFKQIGLFFTLLFKGEIIKPRVVLVLALIFGFCLFVFRDKPNPHEQFYKIYSTVADKSIPSQSAFNEIHERYLLDIRKSTTELESAQITRMYKAELNGFFRKHINERSNLIENWFARIDRIESLNNGKTARVYLVCDFPYARYKISPFLVSSRESLFYQVVPLKSGDYVLFSGEIEPLSIYPNSTYVDLFSSNGPKLSIECTDITLIKGE